jgi:hypothetical protein
MGVMLATLVSIRWAHLPERQFKVLNRMALMALDKPNSKGQPASIYFGGWEPLSLALNREVPETPIAMPRSHEDHHRPGEVRSTQATCGQGPSRTPAVVDADSRLGGSICPP